MRIRVHVRPKAGVLDPQGEAVRRALTDLGFPGIARVRQGKVFEIDLDPGAPTPDPERICQELLANPVIEDYEARIEDPGDIPGPKADRSKTHESKERP